MRYGIAEHKLRSDDQDLEECNQWNLKRRFAASPYFWGEAFEQGGWAFVPEEVFHDGDTADLVFEIGILDTGLDNI